MVAAADKLPDLILLDVMMPNMDGPTTLAHLRENPKTANIPVVFMTARAQARELEHFLSLGAAGVIAKPFDPMKLAAEVRRFSQTGRIANMRVAFIQRARKDAAALASYRRALKTEPTASKTLADIILVAHGLAGVAGIYGFADISETAADLEHDVIAAVECGAATGQVGRSLDALVALLEHAGSAGQRSRFALDDDCLALIVQRNCHLLMQRKWRRIRENRILASWLRSSGLKVF